ncbi:hypothetical protein [Afipia sp. GAS231]|uniref:hypothetical protein n=1 Tax=Afipia sp. GAS231 TaxID=1882747 RepID=UPI00087D123F|nr:hypothetical protein [Afipia sp. GAS231]SDN16434.1 hypothetical protein SAMN05444050_0864 [Afipia sp. GAS231]
MKWMRERDLLIAQTMAFVQSVTGKKPEAEKTVATSATTSSFEPSETAAMVAPMPDIEALMAEALDLPKAASRATSSEAPKEMTRAVQTIARADLRSGFQSEISEIKARVANFRAHQQRFNQEREAYCSATMAKVHATLSEMPTAPRAGK